MKIKPNSSNIEEYAYSNSRLVLAVKFKSGKAYFYKDVPSTVFFDMQRASSAGTFLNSDVKKTYDVDVVTDLDYQNFVNSLSSSTYRINYDKIAPNLKMATYI